ncbi:hypothetical protein [Cyanobium sp. ATX 6F1]|uniref:hypothetical protein n=1 Tax=Cyanobium sp. ATX 6F1 TaxID=2823702 RepID=UPI0020CCB8DE|nr:hypothetical protein [Cyanobium sp. ATX 6F1]
MLDLPNQVMGIAQPTIHEDQLPSRQGWAALRRGRIRQPVSAGRWGDAQAVGALLQATDQDGMVDQGRPALIRVGWWRLLQQEHWIVELPLRAGLQQGQQQACFAARAPRFEWNDVSRVQAIGLKIQGLIGEFHGACVSVLWRNKA